MSRMLQVLLAFVVAFGITQARAEPPPSGLLGAYWAAGNCNAVTFSTPAGPRVLMVDVHGNLCVTGAITTIPAAVTGFGTVAATNASALLSTLTAGPNSAVWPTTPGMVYVINSSASAGVVDICPLGGTCTAAVGVPIAPGGWYGFYKPATTMTIIASSTASVSAQW